MTGSSDLLWKNTPKSINRYFDKQSILLFKALVNVSHTEKHGPFHRVSLQQLDEAKVSFTPKQLVYHLIRHLFSCGLSMIQQKGIIHESITPMYVKNKRQNPQMQHCN